MSKTIPLLIVISSAHDGYRRAGFKLQRGENTLHNVRDDQVSVLSADKQLTVAVASEAETATKDAVIAKHEAAQADSEKGAVDSKGVDDGLTVEQQILAVIPELPESAFTKNDGPKVGELERVLGFDITAEQRDVAWSAYDHLSEQEG